jgi:hypothetical protein
LQRGSKSKVESTTVASIKATLSTTKPPQGDPGICAFFLFLDLPSRRFIAAPQRARDITVRPSILPVFQRLAERISPRLSLATSLQKAIGALCAIRPLRVAFCIAKTEPVPTCDAAG